MAVLTFTAMKAFTNWFGTAAVLKDAGSYNDIEAYLLHAVDCPRTIAAVAASCNGVTPVNLRRSDNSPIVGANAASPADAYFSTFGLKVTCSLTADFYRFNIEAAKYTTAAGTTFSKNLLTGDPTGFRPLFSNTLPFICKIPTPAPICTYFYAATGVILGGGMDTPMHNIPKNQGYTLEVVVQNAVSVTVDGTVVPPPIPTATGWQTLLGRPPNGTAAVKTFTASVKGIDGSTLNCPSWNVQFF